MGQDRVVRERKESALSDCWNVEAMYESWDEWKKDFNALAKPGSIPKWPEFAKDQVDLTTPLGLKKALDALMKVDCDLNTLYTYAHLRHDEDVAEDQSKKAYMEATSLLHVFQEETSWIHPALLQQPQEVLDRFLQSKDLEDYHIYLEKILRLKAHTLSAEEEKLMAFADKALETSHRTFSSLNNADLRFPSCCDEKGKMHELTHGTYQLYLKSPDRVLRKEAFMHLHQTFALYENTLCDLLQGQMQQHVFCKKARSYNSCLEAALYPHQIHVDVYSSLVDTVRKGLPSLHKYIDLRKKSLGLEELHLYDMSVPLLSEIEIKIPYEEAVDAVVESVACLGEEYQKILRKGLTEDRWIDRYENKKKRSGAYSSGCYTSMPYILLNYHETFQDAMTLTHEAGHSMHSYFSAKHQKYQDHHYPIFLAEVASTFHEELLFRFFLQKVRTPEEKAYLVNQKIEGIRATLFRQTMFAEFEKQLHEWVEQDHPLTPALLKEEYLRLTREYFGPNVVLDEEVASEWSRIPHFYYNFYVYQYSTGISAAHVLAKRVIEQGAEAREKYLSFLSSGSSKDPLQTLLLAGVDMKTPYAVSELLAYFDRLVAELRELLMQMKKL